MKVKEIIKELENYPDDAECYAYEGEICGLIIVKRNKQIGVIYASRDDTEEELCE